MVFNVMIQLCKITRSSKLFQRNFYLPLLKPLSPKDALRRHIITGKNLLGSKIEHYIPVLEEYQARVQRRKYEPRGQGKKRQRKKTNMRYVAPFLDDDMENHSRLRSMLSRKSKGKGQCYTYFVPDKNLTLVFTHQMERAIRDKDIMDVVIAQRSEKIVVKLKDGMKITLPITTYDERAPFYSGEGWTKKEIEEYHHHGKETMGIAKLFEAKESGVEEWELEMMRMASKRKVKKHKGEGTKEWKSMMSAAAESMDWDKFEEDSKQIVEEQHDAVEDEPIPMEIDDMEKTKNVNEKLSALGPPIFEKLPLMEEIPEIIRTMKNGEMAEVANVSGIKLILKSGEERFVTGQIVKSEDGDLFVPGQTVENDDGECEYTPGITILMDDEPTLIPGLVMGDDPEKPMFLPGDSTITETGELQFTETEDDRPRLPTPPPEEVVPEIEEVELEEEQNSEEEREEKPRPPPRKKQVFIYNRPKRLAAPESIKRRERGSRKLPQHLIPEPEPDDKMERLVIEPVLYDLTQPMLEKDLLLQEKERVEVFTEKKAKEEVAIDKKKKEIKTRAKEIVDKAKIKPKPYKALDPVKKSSKLEDMETSIKKGNFFDVDHKKYLVKERSQRVNWLENYDYRNTFDSVGIMRHRVWKSVH